MNLDRANAMVELKQLKSLINDLELIKTNFTNPYYKHNTDESMRKEYSNSGKGRRTRTIGGEELKNKLRNGEINA